VSTTINDNPVRIARIQRGWSQSEFCQVVKISRPSLNAIEDGRTQTPDPVVADAMDEAFGFGRGTIAAALRAWRSQRDAKLVSTLSVQQQAILAMEPAKLADTFATFAAWRGVFAPTTNAFARLLGINHAVTSGYEQGIRKRGMPESMQRALLNVLQLKPAYLVALMKLEPAPVLEDERSA
jgi:transcriptional regulator with XRE-family HTH domain